MCARVSASLVLASSSSQHLAAYIILSRSAIFQLLYIDTTYVYMPAMRAHIPPYLNLYEACPNISGDCETLQSPHSVPQWLVRMLKALKSQNRGWTFHITVLCRRYADVMQTLCTTLCTTTSTMSRSIDRAHA